MGAPAPLSQPAFRSLWTAGLVSEAGDWLLFIALPIVVYQRTGSAVGTSFAFLAMLAPAIVLAPFAGRLADRYDRRRLMLVVTGLQALALLPLLTGGAGHGLVIVYAVLAAESSLTTIFDPAKNALLPRLVVRDQLVSANSLVALNDGIARLVGGPLGGLLLATGELRTVVLADAASYVIAAGLIAGVPAEHGARAPGPITAVPRTRPPSARRFRGVLRHRPVRVALAVSFFADIAQGIFLVLFIVFVARRLHGGAGETGLLRGVQAIGAIAAGLVMATVPIRDAPARLMAGAAIAFGTVSLLLWNLPGLTTSPIVYACLFAIAGAPGVVLVTGMVTFLQQAVGDHERGRAFGALGLADNAGEALGMIAAGLLTGPLGLGALLDLQASIYLITGLLLAALAWRAGGLAPAGTEPADPPGRPLSDRTVRVRPDG